MLSAYWKSLTVKRRAQYDESCTVLFSSSSSSLVLTISLDCGFSSSTESKHVCPAGRHCPELQRRGHTRARQQSGTGQSAGAWNDPRCQSLLQQVVGVVIGNMLASQSTGVFIWKCDLLILQ